ncbi:hypothetical protein AMJ40_03935 [candidate division TA06 bacterium DG_26]|uniref:Phosphoribose diphosphate--decaprenyl-phosphate phosphoribosyltransferase n=1 Tax=candidate division TA06 bacterium DG_26 TaxID=1703771 RepID=A0A0S7WJ56_UNCT6|nr:MAG: hypothetical protein AMJ40_03935 [candidate division TA06 bacterium DG_26]
MVDLIRSMRPAQWTKNLIVFAGIIFSGNLFRSDLLFRSAITFAIFCLLSGAMYIMNDILDRNQDTHHPLKSKRPISLGIVSTTRAKLAIPVLTIVPLILAWILEPRVAIAAAAYAGMMSAYSLWLKRIPILDVLIISFGLFLRALSGAFAVSVEMSVWLFLCTILLALFLALCKRKHELLTLEDAAGRHRRVLEHYTDKLLDQMIAIATGSTIIAYAIYTISPETVGKFHTKNLVFTFPIVLFGLFRYLYLVYRERAGGAPEQLLLNDRQLIASIVLWAIAVGTIIYV